LADIEDIGQYISALSGVFRSYQQVASTRYIQSENWKNFATFNRDLVAIRICTKSSTASLAA